MMEVITIVSESAVEWWLGQTVTALCTSAAVLTMLLVLGLVIWSTMRKRKKASAAKEKAREKYANEASTAMAGQTISTTKLIGTIPACESKQVSLEAIRALQSVAEHMSEDWREVAMKLAAGTKPASDPPPEAPMEPADATAWLRQAFLDNPSYARGWQASLAECIQENIEVDYDDAKNAAVAFMRSAFDYPPRGQDPRKDAEPRKAPMG